MERHDALKDLSRDHFAVLNRCQEVRHTLEGGRRAFPVPKMVERLLVFWDDHVQFHFEEEEEVLLPALEPHLDLDADEDVARMLDDHDWFRETFPRLRDARDAGDEEAMRDLLAEVGEALHDHARFEERLLFDKVQRLLDEDELQALWEASKAYRIDTRGPSSVGPG